MARQSKVMVQRANGLEQRVEQAKQLAAQIRALFPEAHALPASDRARSRGKIGPAESAGFRGVLAAVDLHPDSYAVLADEDEGHDPERLETDLLRARLDEHDLYAALAAELQSVAEVVSDAALDAGAKVKPVAQAAYEIAKPIAKRDAATREKIKPLLDYYGANAAAGVATRKKKQA